MNTETKPIGSLAQELGLKAKVMKANSKKKPDWAKQEWLVLVSCGDRTLSFNYYGGGSVETPTVTDCAWVLGIEYVPEDKEFQDWASEYGLDLDSAKAFKDFNSMVERSRELEYLFGSKETAQLLSESAREY